MRDDSFTYMAGEVLTDTQAVPGLAPAVILSDGYSAGNRTQPSANLGGTVNQATSAVTGGTPDFLNTYSYTASATNPYGQMSQVSQGGNGGNAVAAKSVAFQYDLQAELTGVGRYQSANATANLVAQATYGRDNDGDLTSLVYANNSSTLPNYSWTYNSLGDMATATETLGSIVNSVSYTSDSTGQLLTATGGPAAETFAYDTNGNRQQVTTGTSTAQYTTGPNNEVVCDGTNCYAFDANGNCISQTNLATGAQIQYSWDNRNRLVKVTFLDGNQNLLKTVNYTYDAFNRWIGETITTYSGQTSTTTQTRFVYDGNQIVMQFDGTGTAALIAANLSHRYLWGPAVDQLLADEQLSAASGGTDNPSTPGSVVWALGDNQNTVRDLATYANGVTTVVNHRVFSAYGELLTQTNAAVNCLFAYTGEPLSVFSVNTTTGAETGLQNNDNRWYNAIIGRWLSQDPLGLGPDSNPYRYCSNGPGEWSDPNGLAENAAVVTTQAYEPQSFWDFFRDQPPTPSTYGYAGWYSNATWNPLAIGTAVRQVQHALPADVVTFGDITLYPEYGGGTISQATAARAASLASNYDQLPGESRSDYIRRLIEMAKNGTGETLQEANARLQKQLQDCAAANAAAHPPQLKPAAGWTEGMTEEQRRQWEETREELEEAAERMAHAVLELQEQEREAGEVQGVNY